MGPLQTDSTELWLVYLRILGDLLDGLLFHRADPLVFIAVSYHHFLDTRQVGLQVEPSKGFISPGTLECLQFNIVLWIGGPVFKKRE